MTALKAFVGHSFTEDDEDVVRTFLKFFDQIKDMNIGFSWDHAESAEVKELAGKVLGLMQDKNLFIGICTNKEAAIATRTLSRPWFDKKALKAREEHFISKTSDWIIQEIGVAIGKGMELILLVEHGVRPPGGLQGDLEYIPFDRQSPEKAFGKVLEMIQSLNPKAKPLAGEEAESRATAVEKRENESRKDEEWLKPRPDWNRDDFELALFHMIVVKDEKRAHDITEAYLSSKEGQICQNLESWKAYQEYTLLMFGQGGKLAKLDEFAKAHPENSDVQKYRAQAYQRYGDQEKAAHFFEDAAQQARSLKQELARYGDAALAYTRAGKKTEAKRVIEKDKALVPAVENGEIYLLKALRSIAEAETNKDDLFGLTERLLDLYPADIDARFSLAYLYSEEGEAELSLFHYLKIPYGERNAIAWNNLGVQLAHFDMDSRSVKAYRKAEELGQTLAMSNLAQKLIGAGFLEEATAICARALAIENYHKNVSYALARIKEIPAVEEKKEAEVLQKISVASDFYKDYGRAIIANQLDEHVGRWQGPDGDLKITIRGNVFLAEGSYERTVSSSLALAFMPSPSIPAQVTKYLVRYEGTIEGQAVKALFTRKKDGDSDASSSLLIPTNKGVEVLMIVSASLREILVYEKRDKTEKKFYTLTRIASEDLSLTNS